MQKTILEKEKKHLKSTLGILKDYKNQLEKSIKSLGAATVERLEELRDNPETNAMDFFMHLEQLHAKNAAFNLKDRYKRLEELESSLDEPYFARIDLKDKKKSKEDKIYIGKFGFTENYKPVITDWRSKIASVYYRYRYPQENVSYKTPEGVKTRDLTLKRTFDIEEGQLSKYYNNDIQLDESEIIAEKIEARTGGVLEDIVETIQAAQLDIIEEDPRTPVVVQGCVGSGKSTVAIHKLSHIFFNYPKLIKPERSILIAKKQILVSYLATLFPKLGIFDINYKTLRDLVYNFIFREGLAFQPDFSLPMRKELLDMQTLRKARKILNETEATARSDLEKFFVDDYASFGGYAYDPDLTPYENYTYVLKEQQEEFKNQKELYKDNPKSSRAWLYKLNSDTLRKIVKDLKKKRSKIKDKELSAALKTLEIDPSKKADYATALAYAYVYSKIIGFKEFRKYHYCVVDEGQDFSPMEYAVMKSFVLHNRFCILGDLNQGYVESGLMDWKSLSEVFNSSKIKEFSLETNYRSTRPIINYANKILAPFTDKYLPNSINRKGVAPIEKDFKEKSAMYAQLEKDLQSSLKDLKKSIGIISYDPADFEKLKSILADLPIENSRKTLLDSDKKIDYKPKSVYLTGFENCKGLEFAEVYIVGRDPLKNPNFQEAKKSFVGVTRAMDRLTVYYTSKEGSKVS